MCARSFGDSGEPDTDSVLRWPPSLGMDTDPVGNAVTGAGVASDAVPHHYFLSHHGTSTSFS